MSESATTPNDMPGAAGANAETSSAAAESTSDNAAATAAAGGLDASERAELARLREVHKDEQKYRREATDNHRDAEAYRNLLGALGVKDGKEAKAFDAQAAVTELNTRLESERIARLRSEVARTEGLEPEDFTGSTEEEMRASAQRFKARIEAEVEKRAKAPASAAAPAAEVTSNGKVTGPQQITSRDQLKSMSAKEIVEAREAGLLDDLQSGKAT
ncbi:hypothetical protein OS122_02545 [Mycolicibacterium mucogenicum]|uniref:hypothetical protein n=1 Tax=Mycolicibacterium mucogenicum TaxID=56689 RepID=UPI00226A5C6B|nr:hypothetical protein [Mycolicibacterium mucogenicum]MCX8559778.1 hypothetical protein [Mycolicibacterium mucogenicum]